LPVEARDALALLDHLGLQKAAILGTSRGGLLAMVLAATAKDRLLGACLNDIGPVVDAAGLDVIRDYLGKNPTVKTYAEAAPARARAMAGFANVPDARWMQEVRKHYVQTADGLKINYDPDLVRIFERAEDNPAPPDFWPVFDALADLPLALIRGANSNILSPETAAEMRRRRPDMVFAEVPDRGHVPFLDEPAALTALRNWLGKMQ
jgi:pimeloyl-ACP methyl ester carboxylesterase